MQITQWDELISIQASYSKDISWLFICIIKQSMEEIQKRIEKSKKEKGFQCPNRKGIEKCKSKSPNRKCFFRRDIQPICIGKNLDKIEKVSKQASDQGVRLLTLCFSYMHQQTLWQERRNMRCRWRAIAPPDFGKNIRKPSPLRNWMKRCPLWFLDLPTALVRPSW